MTILDRYLLTRFVITLLKAIAALISVYILIDLLTNLRQDILEFDVPGVVVAEYYLASIPKMLYQITPLAVLISALLVLGECAQNNEVVAALAGGISLRRLVRMPVAAALALSVLVFAIEEVAGAPAARAAAQLESRYFFQAADTKRQGRSWAGLSKGWTFHALKFNRLALTGEKVLMRVIRPDAIEQINAKRVFWDPDSRRWMLEDGFWQVFKPDSSERLQAFHITQRAAPISETPEDLFALEEDPDTKTASALAADIRAANRRGMPVTAPRVDYHAKFSQPALSFVMIGLAIPFALRLRRGGLAISFGMSVAIALAYLVLFGIGMSLGHAGRLSPPVAAWLANAIFLGTGVLLFYRTPT